MAASTDSIYDLGSETLEIVPIGDVIELLNKSTADGADAQQKEKIKEELAGKFENLDKTLDVIVKDNQESFKESVKTFTSLYQNLQAADSLLERLAQDVIGCQDKLTLRKENFIQLWCSHVELEEMLRQLDLVDDVRKASEQAKVLCSEKQFYVAARLLTSTLNHLDTDLSIVGALQDYKSSLQAQHAALYDTLIEELHVHIYHKWKEADRGSYLLEDERENLYLKMSRSRNTSTATSFSAKRMYQLRDCVEPSSENNTRYMSTLLDALRVLGKLPAALDAIQQRLSRELNDVIRAVVEDSIRSAPAITTSGTLLMKDAESESERNGKRLAALLLALSERLQSVMQNYAFVLDTIHTSQVHLDTARPAVGTVGEYVRLQSTQAAESGASFSAADVWAAVQKEVHELVFAYLAIPEAKNAELTFEPPAPQRTNRLRSVATLDRLDVSSFFLPTHVQRERSLHRTKPLFTFAGSEYAQAADSRQESVMVANSNQNAYPMICSPDPHLLTVCFEPVQAFCSSMDSICGITSRESGELQKNIHNYAHGAFLDYIRAKSFARLKAACEDPDAFTGTAGTVVGGSSGPGNAVAKSVLAVESIQDDIQAIAWRLGALRDNLMAIMIDLLATYAEHCNETYEVVMRRTFMGSDGSYGQALSMEWGDDPALAALLQQFSTWQTMKSATDPNHVASAVPSSQLAVRDKMLHDEQMNTELHLIAQLPNGVRRRMLLRQRTAFAVLANMNQSLEWLANKLLVAEATLYQRREPGYDRRASGGTRRTSLMNDGSDDTHLQFLRARYVELGQLADKCLMTLKLEARCQSYYYITIFLQKSVFNIDSETLRLDDNVSKLNEVLAAIEEFASPYLPSVKLTYIFDRLDTMMNALVRHYVGSIQSINALGVEKLCRNLFGLKQNLTNITLKPSKEFDTTISYCELLYQTIKDIVNDEIVGKPPRFKLREYEQLFELLHRSAGKADDTEYRAQLERLRTEYKAALQAPISQEGASVKV